MRPSLDSMGNGRKPTLPCLGWGHQTAWQPALKRCVTAHLDAFIAANVALEKNALVLKYVEDAPANVNVSQYMQAEMAYIFFKSDEIPFFTTRKKTIGGRTMVTGSLRKDR